MTDLINILRAPFTGADCQIGYVEGDDLIEHSPVRPVHGRWRVKLGYIESDEFVLTFYGATSFTGDGYQIGIRRR